MGSVIAAVIAASRLYRCGAVACACDEFIVVSPILLTSTPLCVGLVSLDATVTDSSDTVVEHGCDKFRLVCLYADRQSGRNRKIDVCKTGA